jgi:uncharacterized membrane protein YcaP (DUF421 family)
LGPRITRIPAALSLVSTLVGIDILLSFVKRWVQLLDDVLESVPALLLENGRLLEGNMRRERVEIEDIMETARDGFGIERFNPDQVRGPGAQRLNLGCAA